jgi:hypothetical protein
MFELAWWLCYVGAEPILSLASRNSRARQLRRPTRSHAPERGDFLS